MVGGFGPVAKILGPQAAYESVFFALTPALAGADILCGVGLLDGDTLLSFEQLIIDYEIGTMILRIIRGFDVNDETLALDLINKVGPGGNYLAEKHTLEHVHECWRPMISDISSYGAWVAAGSKTSCKWHGRKLRKYLQPISQRHWMWMCKRALEKLSQRAKRRYLTESFGVHTKSQVQTIHISRDGCL